MLTDEVRRRLEALNRQALPVEPAPRINALQPVQTLAQPAPSSTSRYAKRASDPAPHRFDLQSLQRARLRFDAGACSRPPAQGANARKLHELVAGVECAGPSGKYYRIARSLHEFWPGAGTLPATEIPPPATEQPPAATEQPPPAAPNSPPTRLAEGQPARSASRHRHVQELNTLGECFPRDAVLLDLETCGLAGSMIFLVGLIWRQGETLVVDQLLARDYAEERAILAALRPIVSGCRLLVTFNGKSFDWPMVQDRTTLHALFVDRADRQRAAAMLHCDVLHHARRAWRHLTPNCRLQTLERMFCGRHRLADIAGADIPAAYHDFVRDGDARQIAKILEHNALDLVTLAQLSSLLIAR